MTETLYQCLSASLQQKVDQFVERMAGEPV